MEFSLSAIALSDRPPTPKTLAQSLMGHSTMDQAHLIDYCPMPNRHKAQTLMRSCS